MSAPLVLVTGATGYVASHVIQVLLKNDYRVRGTVRDIQDKEKYAHLKDLSPDYERNPVELVVADLLEDYGWEAAVEGCRYVIHIAAPFPSEMPDDDEVVMRPTIDGTMRVLKACAKEAHKGLLKRVVMLNQIAAVAGEPIENCGRVFTENDYTNENAPLVDVNSKARSIAERKAWEFMKNQDHFDFCVIVGSFAIGPVFHNRVANAQEVLYRLMDRKRMPLLPEICLHICDSRDLAELAVKGLTTEKASGVRFIFSTGKIWLKDTAELLQDEFGDQGYKIAQTTAPYSVLWVASYADKKLKNLLRFCKKDFDFDSSKTLKVFNLTPRDTKKTLIEATYSYIEKGILHKAKHYRPINESTN